MFLKVGLVVSIPVCGSGSSACQGTTLEKGQTFQCRILGGAHEPEGHWSLLLVSIKVVLGLKLPKTKMELFHSFCLFYVPRRSSVKGTLIFLIWCWNHMKNVPCFCVSPSAGGTSQPPGSVPWLSGEVLHLPSSILWHGRLWKCFPFYLHLGRFFFFFQ